jgi:hypothetical protein
MDIYFLFYPPNPVILVYGERSVRFVIGMQTTVTSHRTFVRCYSGLGFDEGIYRA